MLSGVLDLGRKVKPQMDLHQTLQKCELKEAKNGDAHGTCMVPALEKQVSPEFSSLRFLDIKEMLKMVCVCVHACTYAHARVHVKSYTYIGTYNRKIETELS